LKLILKYLSTYRKSNTGLEEFVRYEDVIEPSNGRIAYVKNNFTEKAFWEFSKIVTDPKAAYSQSFEGACEDVYNSVAQYCILPIENSSDGKLINFYSLIDKYDLKIFALCSVDYADASSSTKFALLKKNLDILYPFDNTASCVFLEISYTQNDNLKTVDILRAAEFFGANLVRIDSVKLEYSDDQYKFYSVFSASCENLIPFLIYLYIYVPEFFPIGIYKQI
jgi:prephenate dehydratase